MLNPWRLEPIVREAYEDTLIDWLWRVGAIDVSGTVRFHFQDEYQELADYETPPVHFDDLVIQSDLHCVDRCVRLLRDDMAKHQDPHYNKIAGVANSAIPMAIHLGNSLGIGHVTVLREDKKDGGKQIEGTYKEKDYVLTYENAFSTGGSVVRHFKKLWAERLRARLVVGFLDYNIGSRYQFNEEDILLFPLFSIKYLMDVLVRINRIDADGAVKKVDYFEKLRSIIVPLIATKRAKEPVTKVF